jgi:TonB family protein
MNRSIAFTLVLAAAGLIARAQPDSGKKNIVVDPKPVDMRSVQRLPYPKPARRLGMEGRIMVSIHVDDRGKAGDHEIVSSSHPIFFLEINPLLRNAVSRLVFTPMKKDGKPVDCWVSLPLTFRLLDQFGRRRWTKPVENPFDSVVVDRAPHIIDHANFLKKAWEATLAWMPQHSLRYVFRARVNPSGQVTDVRGIATTPGIDNRLVEEIVRAAKFAPGMVEGREVDCWTTVVYARPPLGIAQPADPNTGYPAEAAFTDPDVIFPLDGELDSSRRASSIYPADSSQARRKAFYALNRSFHEAAANAYAVSAPQLPVRELQMKILVDTAGKPVRHLITTPGGGAWESIVTRRIPQMRFERRQLKGQRISYWVSYHFPYPLREEWYQ